MFGRDGWRRPLTVAVLVSGAVFLPQGVAVASPDTLNGASCAQPNGCPRPHDGANRLFVGPVLGSHSPVRATASPSGSSVAGTTTTGSATAGTAAEAAATSGVSGAAATSGTTGASGATVPGADTATDASTSGSTGTGTSTTSSPADSTAGNTTAGTHSGATACPDTSGTATTSSAADSATGSVTTGTAARTATSTAVSVPNVTGAGAGTATSATTQALASTPGSGVPVAGTAVNAEASAAGSANLPGDVIDLAPWYLTLPTGKQGSPDTVENPALAKFTNDFFKLNTTRDGVVFSARGDGVTTKNSKYPRSELREMNGSEKAAWSNTTGSHTLDVCEAITKVPSAKPEVVGAQIHDAEDDVLQIRLEGQTLMAQYDDGKSETVIDPAYELGTPYNVRIVAADGKVDVLYNGQKKAELPLKGSGWYWKVGAYVQSNTSKGDADSVGEVTVYSLKCVHA
jgi:hypothetical protein